MNYTQHGHQVREHRLTVPLNHREPHGEQIELFAREVTRPGGEKLPPLLFLQGGPGGAGPRPGDFATGWIGEALADYRVVLLDQRGTGQSSQDAVLPDSDRALADHLSLFLQDQIIADAEALRAHLEVDRWVTLGQSYGGFLTLAYLSAHPEAIERSFITGGLPGLGSIDEIYRLTYRATAARNRAYFRHYPQDEATLRAVAGHLEQVEECLPTGERLTPTRLRMLGMSLGTQTAYDLLHYLLEGPFVSRGGERRLTPSFLAGVGAQVSHAGRPLYAALQEAIYGPTSPAGTRWAAERLAGEFAGFNLEADPLDQSEPWYLTGEHMFRAFFEEDPSLVPYLGAVDLLAEKTDWAQIYDQSVLSQIDVPIAAAVYYDDMFVPRELSLETAALLGARTLVTNEFQHDGLRAGDVFARLKTLMFDH